MKGKDILAESIDENKLRFRAKLLHVKKEIYGLKDAIEKFKEKIKAFEKEKKELEEMTLEEWTEIHVK